MQTHSADCITKHQIKKIHALKNRLEWSDDAYRAYLMIEADGFATSCKDLSEAEAERIIRKMELAAVARGVWKSYSRSKIQDSKNKYDELGKRSGMASPKQLRMIEAMWAGVSYYREREAREGALRKFVKRIAGVDRLEFLEARQARKVVEAMKAMAKTG